MTTTLSLKNPLPSFEKAPLQTLTPESTEETVTKPAEQAPYSRKKVIKEAIQWLSTTYPAAFNLESLKPLQIGIEKILFCQEQLPYSRTLLRKAIAYYIGSPHYQKAILQSSHRVTLEGTQAEEITPKQKEYAGEKLNQWESKRSQFKKRHTSPQNKKPNTQSQQTRKEEKK